MTMTTPRDALRALEQIATEMRNSQQREASSDIVAACIDAWQCRLVNATTELAAIVSQMDSEPTVAQQLATAGRTIAELRLVLDSESRHAIHWERQTSAYQTECAKLRARAESAELTNQQLAEKCLRLVAENDLLRARTADSADTGASVSVPREPTEEIIDSVRYMITGIEMSKQRSIGRFRQHCTWSGVEMDHWPEWARDGKHDDEHLTKAGIAILFYHQFIYAALSNPTPKST